MQLNLDTVWHDTYRDTKIAGDHMSNMSVFSAIHSTAGPILRLELVTRAGAIELKGQINLTPDEAEAMAAELLISAQLKRVYDDTWAAYQAEQLPEAA